MPAPGSNSGSLSALILDPRQTDQALVHDPGVELSLINTSWISRSRSGAGILASREWRWRVAMMVAVAVAVLGNVVQVEAATLGVWRVVTKNAGITAMHAAVTPVTGNVVLLHHTNNGPSNMTFPDGRCRDNPLDRFLKHDCYVHSVIIDANTGVVRPLMLQTDTQCSSAQFLADGTLGQTGGDREGSRVPRNLGPSCFFVEPTNSTCDWIENAQKLTVSRWYATNHLLPDGRQIVVGGREQASYEYSPPVANSKPIYMDFLKTSADHPNATSTNNLYPYVYLLPNGHLYIFANRDSIIFDYINNAVVRTFPKIPGNPRNYPSAGSSVMLPLKWQDNFQNAEVVVCGGATTTSAVDTNPQPLCSVTCGRIMVTKAKSKWKMENMPVPRCMGDMVLLPDTNVLIINGAQRGLQGWGTQSEPTLNPVLYEPKKKTGKRFSLMEGTLTPRVYHSTANLLTDGSVMVAGSNTNEFYNFVKVSKWWPPAGRWFPTELSVEAFTPPYAQTVAGGRPRIVSPANGSDVKFNSVLEVVFWDDMTRRKPSKDVFLFTLNSSPFSTHSFSHGQRLVSIKMLAISTVPGGTVENGSPKNLRTVQLQIPADSTVLPPAYYMLWVVKNGNPSTSCIWVRTTQ